MLFFLQFIRQLLIEVIVTLIEFRHVIYTHISGRFRHVIYYLLQGAASCLIIIHKSSNMAVGRNPRQSLSDISHTVEYAAVMLRCLLTRICHPREEVHESLEDQHLVAGCLLSQLTIGT